MRRRRVREPLALTVACLVMLAGFEGRAVHGTAASYTLSGSPDGTGGITVDDGLDVFLNGVPIYTDGGASSGVRPPITFQGDIGDDLQFVVRDTFGDCTSLTPIFLIDAAGRSIVADPGFNLGCGRPAADLGVVHDHSFVIPDLSITPVAEFVSDMRPGAASGSPSEFAVFQNALYFSAEDGVNGRELWRLGPTGPPTLVADLLPGAAGSDPHQLTVAGDRLYFVATTPSNGQELWQYDGVTPPSVAEDIWIGAQSSGIIFMTALGTEVVFRATDGTGDELFAFGPAGLKPFDIWKNDPSCDPAGNGCASSPYGLTVYQGVLYFGASDEVFGTELHQYDGTTVTRLTDIVPGLSPSNPQFMTGIGNRLVFSANAGFASELYAYDLTTVGAAPTLLTTGFSGGFFGAQPQNFTSFNGRAYFSVDDATLGRELWTTDGTQAGTRPVADINPGAAASAPSRYAAFNGELYFGAADATNGHELRATNGVGVRLVTDFNPGVADMRFDNPTPFGAFLFLSLDQPSPAHPGFTTGTAIHVVRQADGTLINPTGSSVDDAEFVPFNGALYFRATDGVRGTELWKITVGNGNQAPVAAATAPPTATAGANCLADVALNGSGSSDPDGDALTYSWSENGIEIASGVNPTVSLSVGTHAIRLTVRDPSNATDTFDFDVTVTSAVVLAYVGPVFLQGGSDNLVTVSVADANGPIAGATLEVTVNGVTAQGISDNNGIATMTVGPVSGATTNVIIAYPGAACGPAARTVNVPVNRWPTAIASFTPATAGPGCMAQVALNGAASSDPDGDALTYAWAEGPTPLATGVNPTVPLSGGTHQITLTVSDGRGGTASTTIPVTVSPQPSLITYNGTTQFSTGVPTQVSATLTTDDQTPIAGASVRFAIDNGGIVEFEVFGTTDVNGVATVTLTPPGTGSRNLAVGYFGSACNESIGVNVPITVVAPTGTLTVITTVINDDGGTLAPSDFAVTISGNSPNPAAFPGSAQGVLVTLAVGSFQVVQAPQPDYVTTTQGDCLGTIAAGDSKTCTIINDDRPARLTLNKVVVNDDGGALLAGAWTLTANGQAYAQGVATTVPAGDYILDESGPSGYSRSAWVCPGATLNGSTVTVPKHTDVTCTITNDDLPAQLTLTKVVVNDNGGTAVVGDWPLTANGQPFVSGVGQQVDAGVYALAESAGPAGYAASAWNCTGGGTLVGSQLTIGPGIQASCTITNDDVAGTLTVSVLVINNDGGTAQPGNVTVTVTGGNPSPASFPGAAGGTAVTLNAGAYSADGAPLAGYTRSASADCTGTIALAGAKTCTITYDDDGPVNRPPTANSQNVQTSEDTAVGITLTAADLDNDPLTYTIVAGPSSGMLTGTAPALTYTPNANFNGVDSFTFQVNDGAADSNIATVTITVNPVNDAPTAVAQSGTTAEDTPLAITLTGLDADGDTLSFTVVTPPVHGTLSGTGANLTYTPAPNYFGPDSFSFIANDGVVDSGPASVDITVTAVNDQPVANAQSVTTSENAPLAITLTGVDLDNDPLTFNVVNGPANGILSGTAPNLTYTPNAGFSGSDSFSFTVSDGQVTSVAAAIGIIVTDVNGAPVANAQSLTTPENTPLGITLVATDADNDPLTYTIVSGPTSGTLTGTAPALSYTPAANFYGIDSFTFKANDGQADSNVATVDITVTPVRTDLSVTVDDLPDPVTVGQDLTYTIRVTNNGPADAPGTAVSVALPGNVTVVNAGGCIGTPLNCPLGTLVPTAQRVITIVVQPFNTTSVDTTVSVGSAAPEIVPADNTATATTVVAPANTTTGLTSSLNPSTVGQSVTLTATVSGFNPTGTVTFRANGNALGTGNLANGVATLTTSALAVGTHPLTASYGGDGNNVASTSAPVDQVVNRIVTTTTLASSPNPSTAGQTVTFTATVTGGSPTGMVTFQVAGGPQLGQAAVVNGVATLGTALAAGSFDVTASYGGDAAHLPSTSAAITEQVGLAPTTTTLDIVPNPAAPGTSVLLTATVAGANPSGSVTFLENNTVLGTGTISGGVATLTIPQGKKGNRQISASYPGDNNNLASTSPKVRLTTK